MDRESLRQAHGTIDEKTAEKVDLCNAKGWNTVALLALVAFTEKPEPGLYWGQVLIISYDPEYEVAFSTFIENVGKQLGEEYVPTSPLVAIPLRRSSKLMANGSLRGASLP